MKGKVLGEYTKPQYIEAVLRKYGFRDWDSVLAAIGHGGLKEGQILNKLIESYDKDHAQLLTDQDVLKSMSEDKDSAKTGKHKGAIMVKGSHDVSVRFAKCCNPIPGDEIVGFVTRGRGVTIHRTDCVNVLNMDGIDRERMIEAEWQPGGDKRSVVHGRYHRICQITEPVWWWISPRLFTEKRIDLASVECAYE